MHSKTKTNNLPKRLIIASYITGPFNIILALWLMNRYADGAAANIHPILAPSATFDALFFMGLAVIVVVYAWVFSGRPRAQVSNRTEFTDS